MKTAGLGGGVVAVLLGATSLAAQAVDRAKPPALPPPPALKLPAVQTAALANGLELAVVEMHKVPVVDVQLVLDAGAARDPVDLPGLATFTATMLQQGAGRRGALEIADEAAFLGAQLNTAASYDAATVSLHVPKRRLEPALDLLADLVLRPTFADSEVVRQRELRRAPQLPLPDDFGVGKGGPQHEVRQQIERRLEAPLRNVQRHRRRIVARRRVELRPEERRLVRDLERPAPTRPLLQHRSGEGG